MKRIIIGIHGLSNKPPRHQLKAWWLAAMKEGLERIGRLRRSIPFELVYWADIVYAMPYNSNITDKDDPLYIKEPYQRSIPGDRAPVSDFRLKMFRYFEEQLDKIFLNEDMTINFKGVTDRIIRHFFRDLDTYYGENCVSLVNGQCTAKQAIQERLRQALEKYRGHHIMLIAHSMGSIVAFDVLRTLQNGHVVEKFVTLGSPLGLPVITARIFVDQQFLNPDAVKPQAPESITRQWLNMSDIEDKVALDHTLADDFACNSRGVSAEDVMVYNDYEHHGRRNAHKSYGYLRTPELARAIDDFLGERLKDKLYRKWRRLTRRGMDVGTQPLSN